jgi:hypothetical protein
MRRARARRASARARRRRARRWTTRCSRDRPEVGPRPKDASQEEGSPCTGLFPLSFPFLPRASANRRQPPPRLPALLHCRPARAKARPTCPACRACRACPACPACRSCPACRARPTLVPPLPVQWPRLSGLRGASLGRGRSLLRRRLRPRRGGGAAGGRQRRQRRPASSAQRARHARAAGCAAGARPPPRPARAPPQGSAPSPFPATPFCPHCRPRHRPTLTALPASRAQPERSGRARRSGTAAERGSRLG